MSGLKTLAHLLITFATLNTGLLAIAISQPAPLLRQTCDLARTAFHMLK